MQHKQSAASEQLLTVNNQPLQIGTEETGDGRRMSDRVTAGKKAGSDD